MVSASYDSQIQDLNQSTLKLRDDLTFVPQETNGQRFVHVEVAGTSSFYRIGWNEYVLISLLDGKTRLVDALAITSRQLGAHALSQESALRLCKWLLQNRLGSLVDGAGQVQGSDLEATPDTPLLKRFNPFSIRVPLAKSDDRLDKILPLFGWLFSKWATIGVMVTGVFALVLAIRHWESLIGQTGQVFIPSNWIWMALLWIGLKVVHESSHAICCKYHGGYVKEFGVIFVLFAPLAFVDVTSSWRFGSKWKRIHVAIAGMYAELFVASIALIAWSYCENAMVSQILFSLIVMASFTTLVFNANPLMRFDGYYVLADLISFVNLYTEASKAISGVANWVLWGDSFNQSRLAGKRFAFAAIYGAACYLWRTLICATLLVAAACLWKGAGILLAIFGIVIWFIQPLQRLIMDGWRRWYERPISCLRAGLVTTVASSILFASLFYLPSPFARTAVGVVEYRDLSVVRSISPGFVKCVHVVDGQTVEEGDVLVELANLELTTKLQDLNHQCLIAEQRHAMALDRHETSMAQVESAKLRSLRLQINEQQMVVNGLTIRAPASGRVFARGLQSLIGTFVEPGDQIASIGREDEKEIVLSISDDDIEFAHGQIGEPVRIRINTRSASSGELVRIDPRASVTVPHPALIATAGGPLLVEVSDSDTTEAEYELTEPRFRAVVELPNDRADSVRCGERAHAMLGRFRQSLGAYLYQSSSKWIADRIELATHPSS